MVDVAAAVVHLALVVVPEHVICRLELLEAALHGNQLFRGAAVVAVGVHLLHTKAICILDGASCDRLPLHHVQPEPPVVPLEVPAAASPPPCMRALGRVDGRSSPQDPGGLRQRMANRSILQPIRHALVTSRYLQAVCLSSQEKRHKCEALPNQPCASARPWLALRWKLMRS